MGNFIEGHIMRQHLSQKNKMFLHFAALLLILPLTYLLWVNLTEDHYISVYNSSGTWDLRGFDFENAVASIHGRVDYIPVLLSPAEFAARQDEISHTYPGIRSGTVRVRFLMPNDEYYIITRMSTGYADRIYINGEWFRDVGNPESDELFSPVITFKVRPINGVIEIVHRQSNFLYHVRGVYNQGLTDSYNYGYEYWRMAYTTNIVLGIFLAVAVISLLMFLLLHNYRPALFFALLSFVWFLYTGATGTRVFVTLMPWLTDPFRIRISFVISATTSLLTIVIIRDLFPNLFHRNFIRGVILVSACWIVYFSFADAGFVLSHTLWVAWGMAGAASIYIIIIFAANLRKMDLPRIVFVIGETFMFYAALRDFFTYVPLSAGSYTIMLPPFTGTHFARIGIIVSLLCQAAAIFMATMNEIDKTKETEQRLAAENISLESQSRMKTEFLGNLSHEIKTPLTVILSDIQRIGREIRKHGFESERVSESINRANDEIMRMARLTDSAIKMAAMQEHHDKMDLINAALLFTTGAEGYRSIIEKQGNELIINAQSNLPLIYGNVDRLLGVLSNLLTNANKHTKNGEISVNIEIKKELDKTRFVSVTVKDNGAGITPEILPHVFERGISGSGSTGMGLAICKNIVEAHGGEIEIKSEAGKGTEVSFSLAIHNEERTQDKDV